MSEPTLTCPNCRHTFPLTLSLAQPLLDASRLEFEAKLAAKDQDMLRRQSALDEERRRLQTERTELDETLATRLAEERTGIVEAETRRARAAVSLDLQARDREITGMRELIQVREGKLAEAQNRQAEMISKARELDDARRELDLTIEKRVQEMVGAIRDRSRREAEEELTTKIRERDEQIGALQRQIDILKQKATQASQQLQGEAQELQLEDVLRAKFPFDRIQPVSKGQLGGDILHRVVSPSGQECGTLIWEAKKTRSWSDGWLPKLRQDQREANADLAVLVTHATPKSFAGAFDLIDGIWVCEPGCAVPVALALRESLVALASARLTADGRDEKQVLVYDYLVGPRFRHRLTGIIERFYELQGDLARERRAMTKSWAKREEQLNLAVDGLAGLYGDFHALAGASLKEIESLEYPQLAAPQDAAALEQST